MFNCCTKGRELFRRALALLLSVVLVLGGGNASALPQAYAADSTTYSNYLDGWKVSCAWSTLSTDYTWNATKQTTKQPKIVASYRLENAERDYAAGDIVFDIPGIGNANRYEILMASDLASDAADSDWTCSWDQDNDIYTFTNKFTVSAGQSVSGGFELLWSLSARDTINGYTQSKSPVFYVKDESGTTNSINLTPLTFTFTSVRDRYRISMQNSILGASDWEAADQDYIWYEPRVNFEFDYLARGLYRSSCYLYVDLPEGVNYSDVVYGSSGTHLTKMVNEAGDTVYGFYLFQNSASEYLYHESSERIGFLKSAFIQPDGSYGTITVHAHLNRLYNDESEWVTTAGDDEKVDASFNINIVDYSFTWEGYTYSHRKYTHNYEDSSHDAPQAYRNRLYAEKIYKNYTIDWFLYGTARRTYSDYITGYSLLSRSKANTSGVSQVGINGNSETYSLVLGDDKLAVFLTDGSIRNLTDDEYDMDYVTVSADSYEYDYEVFGAYTQDTEFEDYVRIGTGNTSSRKTIRFPNGIKAMYIRMNNIDGSYDYTANVGIKLHLDWDAEQAKAAAGEPTVDTEGRLVNFSYLRSLYIDSEGDEVNDCAMTTDNYGGSYGAELAERDLNLYEENLMRAYSNVWLRSPLTNLATSTKLNAFTRNNTEDISSGFSTTAVSTGSIKSDDSGTLTSFSLYAVIPEGLEFNFETADLTVAGSGHYYSNNKEATSGDFADHVTYSVGEYNGQQMLIADFDFSDRPLDIARETTVSISYGLTLSYANLMTYGSSYTVDTYLMVHDEGLSAIAGDKIMSDYYDIDQNGITIEEMAYSYDTETVSITATEWREYVSKYVKSYYSSGYETDTVTKLYDGTENAESVKKSSYSYRLDFGLGSNNAKNIDFFDRIEQGAHIATNEVEGEYTDIPTAWQGTFQSVDTSYAESIGLIPTIYYSTDAGQKFDTTDAGWTTTAPADLSTVKAIWIHLDTSDMEDGLMKTKEMVYVIIIMLAPDDETLIDTDAVNQYYVQYDAYGLSSVDDFEARYALPSAETYVTLLKAVGSVTLAKVDGDHEIGTDSEGNTRYASLSGAVFQIYDEKGNALYGDDGVSLNVMNKIIIKNVEFGTYYWEEITAPAGYVKETGLHAFTIDENGGEIIIKNRRVPGTVILTKIDADNTDYGPLADAEFELYTSDGEQVFVDGSYAYSENGTVSRMTTGTDGTLTVTNLPWGSYYFVEVTAPDGYELNDDQVSFTISKDMYDAETDSITANVVQDDKELTASILLIKKDAVDSTPIKDARFSLYKVDTPTDTLVTSVRTNAVGEAQVDMLKFGTYYFVETKNAPGYLMPSGDAAVSKTVTLGASTTEQTLEVSMTNERMTGSVNLSKTDDAGQTVSGAEYTLYYKADGVANFVSVGVYTTDADGEIFVSGLEWGDYYFLETSAPTGYEVSNEKVSFIIDVDTVQSTVYIETVDMRKKGSIVLTKVDAEDLETVLPGAVYELYKTDGSKCILGIDYELANGETEIITGDDGRITITNLTQGGYYLQEVTAPDSYTLSDEKIRFSVTKESSEIVQELTAEDIRGKATLKINKVVNDIYSYYGNPTFLFKIEQIDPITEEVVNTYYQALTLIDDHPTGSTTLTVDQGYEYKVTEVNVNRYQLDDVTADTLNVDAETATADLITEEYAEMTYSNVFDQYEKVSHTVGVVNMMKVRRLLTAILVTYHGANPLTESSSNYDDNEGLYIIPNSDLTVLAIYDDGTETVLDSSAFTILNPTVDGNSNSYTGTVEYEEGGVTKTGTFSIDVDLPAPKTKYTVTFELNGGTIVKDGETTAVATWTYRINEGNTVSEPENAPTKTGYRFKGWYAAADFSTTYDFDIPVSQDTTIYAKWEEAYDVKYAVSIYAINDQDADGTTMALTFGPASGDSYISSYKSHTPQAGEMCIHDMTWEEIISQAHKDPSVFTACLENGCTHSVEINLYDDSGNLKAIGSGNIYRTDGDGASSLYNAINADYLVWNHPYSDYYGSSTSYYMYGTNVGGWQDSAIRNTLNGETTDNMFDITNAGDTIDFENTCLDESTALISCFPEELQYAIYKRAVNSVSWYNNIMTGQATVTTTHDKLWLLSVNEYFTDASTFLRQYRLPMETADGSGTAFARQTALGIMDSSSLAQLYNESGIPMAATWLRSTGGNNSCDALTVMDSGSYYADLCCYEYGLAPCFSIQ